MKNVILVLLLFYFNYAHAQINIVFRLGDNISENDKVHFMAKNRFLSSDFYEEEKISVKKQPNEKIYCLEIHEPATILIAMRPDISSYHEIYLDVSDTIMINKCKSKDSEDYYLGFEGTKSLNDGQYNLYPEEQKWRKNNPPPFYKPEVNLAIHKQKVKDWISSKNNFLSEYWDNNKSTETFMSFIKNQTDCEYTFFLLSPLFQGVADYPKDYFDGDVVGNYNSRPFVVASALYIRWYREVQKYNLSRMKEHIELHFSVDTKEYLLSVMVGMYSDGEGVDRQEYLSLAENYEVSFHQQAYIDYIKVAKEYYTKTLAPIPDSILQKENLISMDNDQEISFHTLLKNNKGKQIYVDFWASWCGPCKRDIEKSHEIKKLFSDNDIVYIYISIDEDRDAWKESANELGISKNQFLLLNIEDSPLLKHIQLQGIPRYIYFNEESSIMNFNGRPPLSGNANYFKDVFDIN